MERPCLCRKAGAELFLCAQGCRVRVKPFYLLFKIHRGLTGNLRSWIITAAKANPQQTMPCLSPGSTNGLHSASLFCSQLVLQTPGRRPSLSSGKGTEPGEGMGSCWCLGWGARELGIVHWDTAAGCCAGLEWPALLPRSGCNVCKCY